jgi:leucyl aminopeptidase
MFDLPDFLPLRVTRAAGRITASQVSKLDHLLVVLPSRRPAEHCARLPQRVALSKLARRAVREESRTIQARFPNEKLTGVTVACTKPDAAFQTLTWARATMARVLNDRPARIGVVVKGFDESGTGSLLAALLSASDAAAFRLPTFKSKAPRGDRPFRSLAIFESPATFEIEAERAAALGNNLARWFTALPANRLTVSSYRSAIDRLAQVHGLRTEFLGERKLRTLKAGAFLAVSQGNATRDAGIIRISYRPRRGTRAALALVGKGILFDTGGVNLKPFKSMLDMHADMQGSAVALGSLVALAKLGVPYGVDAWLAVTENVLSNTAYKSQDIVEASNGTTIQVIHTDAEGRMVLADALAIAAREKPNLILDYATLTGSCVSALTTRYSGVFSNREQADAPLIAAGRASGERVWPFPMDEDFEEALSSDVADIKQCAVEGVGDHILAARFLSRFVPKDIPWVHVDLSASVHQGGLGAVPTKINGFGVSFTLNLLRTQLGSHERDGFTGVFGS